MADEPATQPITIQTSADLYRAIQQGAGPNAQFVDPFGRPLALTPRDFGTALAATVGQMSPEVFAQQAAAFGLTPQQVSELAGAGIVTPQAASQAAGAINQRDVGAYFQAQALQALQPYQTPQGGYTTQSIGAFLANNPEGEQTLIQAGFSPQDVEAGRQWLQAAQAGQTESAAFATSHTQLESGEWVANADTTPEERGFASVEAINAAREAAGVAPTSELTDEERAAAEVALRNAEPDTALEAPASLAVTIADRINRAGGAVPALQTGAITEEQARYVLSPTEFAQARVALGLLERVEEAGGLAEALATGTVTPDEAQRVFDPGDVRSVLNFVQTHVFQGGKWYEPAPQVIAAPSPEPTLAPIPIPSPDVLLREGAPIAAQFAPPEAAIQEGAGIGSYFSYQGHTYVLSGVPLIPGRTAGLSVREVPNFGLEQAQQKAAAEGIPFVGTGLLLADPEQSTLIKALSVGGDALLFVPTGTIAKAAVSAARLPARMLETLYEAGYRVPISAGLGVIKTSEPATEGYAELRRGMDFVRAYRTGKQIEQILEEAERIPESARVALPEIPKSIPAEVRPFLDAKGAIVRDSAGHIITEEQAAALSQYYRNLRRAGVELGAAKTFIGEPIAAPVASVGANKPPVPDLRFPETGVTYVPRAIPIIEAGEAPPGIVRPGIPGPQVANPPPGIQPGGFPLVGGVTGFAPSPTAPPAPSIPIPAPFRRAFPVTPGVAPITVPEPIPLSVPVRLPAVELPVIMPAAPRAVGAVSPQPQIAVATAPGGGAALEGAPALAPAITAPGPRASAMAILEAADEIEALRATRLQGATRPAVLLQEGVSPVAGAIVAPVAAEQLREAISPVPAVAPIPATAPTPAPALQPRTAPRTAPKPTTKSGVLIRAPEEVRAPMVSMPTGPKPGEGVREPAPVVPSRGGRPFPKFPVRGKGRKPKIKGKRRSYPEIVGWRQGEWYVIYNTDDGRVAHTKRRPAGIPLIEGPDSARRSYRVLTRDDDAPEFLTLPMGVVEAMVGESLRFEARRIVQKGERRARIVAPRLQRRGPSAGRMR